MLVPLGRHELESASLGGKSRSPHCRVNLSQPVPQHLGEPQPRCAFYRYLCNEHQHQLNIFDGNPGCVAGSWLDRAKVRVLVQVLCQ